MVSFTLDLAAGVMVVVSFLELLGGATDELGLLQAGAALFAGMTVLAALDQLIPHEYVNERRSGGTGSLARTAS